MVEAWGASTKIHITIKSVCWLSSLFSFLQNVSHLCITPQVQFHTAELNLSKKNVTLFVGFILLGVMNYENDRYSDCKKLSFCSYHHQD
jgi:hypothetical protein